VTSDLDEALALSDRIAVMSQGKLTELFDRADAAEAKIIAASSVGHFQGTTRKREGALS
jgi:erythritol transport system ATP-binding protein